MRTKLTGRLSLLFLSFAMMLALPAMALADVVIVNDVSVGAGNASKAPGATGTANVWLEPEDNLPKGDYNACNVGVAGDNVKATVTLQSSDINKVYFGPDNAKSATTTTQLDTCDSDRAPGLQTPTADNEVAYKVASNAASGSTATISVTNVTGGLNSTNGNQTSQYVTTDTLIVNITAPADTTAPVINSTLNPANADGNNGWYKSNVSLTWSVTDPESNVTKTGCADQNITSDQQATSYSCSATSAGGSSGPVSVSIKRDATAPTNVQFVGDPNAGGTYAFGNVPNQPTCTADDATSTVDSCVVTGYGNAVGSHTLTATATDKAGNKTTATRTYTVNKATAQVNLSDLTQTYNGSPRAATVATVPANLNVDVTYDSNAQAPTNTGSYAVVATVNNANYQGSASGTLKIEKAAATVNLSNLNHTYDGTVKAASASTTPTGLNVDFAYSQNGQAVAEPKNAGDYRVVATVNEDNYQGSKEGTLSIAKASQSITFGALADKTFSDADFNVSAQGGNSGNPVTFAASGNCSVTGTLVSITGAGSCTITASQGGNANHNAAPSVVRSFDIAKAKATLGLVADDLSQVYNGSPRTVGVNTSPDVPDRQITVTYDGSTTAPTNAGSYRVVASLGAHANYFADPVEGTLAITKAPATLSLSGLSKTYNGSPQGAAATTNPANLPGVSFTYNGSQTEPTDAGSYAVVASLTNRNYHAEDAKGTLVIAQKALSVKANDASREYGDLNPALAGVLSGDVATDNISASYSTAATKASGVGDYPIVPSLNDPNNRLSNYDVSKTDGTLKVTTAPLSAKAANATKVYGDALGAADFAGTLTGVKNGDPIAVSYSSAGAAASSDVGDYDIVPALDATAAVLANYDAPVLTNGTLRVTKAPVVLKADDASRFYSDPNPVFTGSIVSGLKNNDVLNLSFTTTATQSSPVGNYAIVPAVSGAKVGNYLVSAQNGMLTVGAWRTTGFYAPVDMLDSAGQIMVNTVKGGSTVPMKFELFKGATELKDVSAVKSTTYAKSAACNGAFADEIEVVMTGSTSLRFDATGDQFIYNWKTPTGAGCYKVTMTAQDGSSLSAYFKTR